MTTASTTSNSLTRAAVNSDTLTKEILATTTTSLDDYSWGFSKDSGSTYVAVPKKGTAAATIYDESQARTTAYSVPVMFGVKTDNGLPSGTYTNDVIYTMTPKSGCLEYSVTWDLDGGTAKSGATYPTKLGWGDTVDLSQLTPTRDGYTFAGWTSGSSNYTGTETAANLNSSNAKSVTVSALWCKTTTNFDYTGGEQTFTADCTGYYKLETWGAAGGYASSTIYRGGYGAYSVGVVYISNSTSLYVVVGQQGINAPSVGFVNGSYNGGGSGSGIGGANQKYDKAAGGGGGATHIATVAGLLKNLSKYKSTGGTNISKEILIVSGGGSGGITYGNSYRHTGCNGGGFEDECFASSQDTGYSFGQGKNGERAGGATPGGLSGGGGGWYGGDRATDTNVAKNGLVSGGGSGYIGSSNLISSSAITKHMTCYSCTTSTADATCTISNTNVSSTATADYSKTGNGYARITYLGTSI